MAKDIHVPARIEGGKIPVKATLGQTVIVTEGPEEYTGPVAVTPTESEQTLQTNGKLVISDISVGAIPDEYIIPTGTEEITVTENGTISRNVSAKETVTVNTNVPIPPGYIVPTGDLEITENGSFNVTEKASVNVNVQGQGELPAVISRIDGGSFALDSDTGVNVFPIQHRLGAIPKGVMLWTEERLEGTTSTRYVQSFYISTADLTASNIVATLSSTILNLNGSVAHLNGDFTSANVGTVLTAETFKNNNSAIAYKANTTYKWLAWV